MSPQLRPQAPFGPTSVEILRSCPLRVCFDASPGYERRLGFAARVGTAFHRVLQSFNEHPLPNASVDAAVEEARVRFQRQIELQIAEAANQPREAGLPHDQNRIDRAAEAVVIEARRVYELGGVTGRIIPVGSGNTDQTLPKQINETPQIEVEVAVASKDGLLNGRVDRAEHRPDGIWLFDYKSALRDDLPGRYERQLRLYAYMWHETRDEWPKAAYVVYPLTSTFHQVSIDPNSCQATADEAAALIQRLQEERRTEELATPGDTCQICDYRPWCQSFWKWQAEANVSSQALTGAELGFEGTIKSIDLDNHHWRLQIHWRSAQVQLIAPEERFPHLAKASAGIGIRVMETPLRGLRHQPKAIVSPRSEIFLIMKD